MEQKEIREYNDQRFSKLEGAKIIKELDDRTTSILAGYNSIAEVGARTKELQESFEVLNTEGIKTYQTLASLPDASGLDDGQAAKVANDPTASNNGYYAVDSGVWVPDSNPYDLLSSSTIFLNLDSNSPYVDVRYLSLTGANQNTTYYLKRASNWDDLVDNRVEVLIEIANSFNGTVVARVIQYGGGSLRSGVLLEDLLEVGGSGITGKIQINWDALLGQETLTLNYPINRNAQNSDPKIEPLIEEVGALKEKLFVELPADYLYDFYYRRTNGTTNTSTDYNTTLYNVEGETAQLYASATISGTGTALAVYLDASEAHLGNQSLGTLGTVNYVREPLVLPVGTKYIAVSNFDANLYGKIEKEVEDVKGMTLARSKNQWENKKIVAIGTSVMFGRRAGKSYIAEASKVLGFNLVNTALAGQAIHAQDDGNGGLDEVGSGSSVLSISEYSDIGVTIPANPIAYQPNGLYNDHFRTWENIFKTDNQDADLYVFAVAPNNTDFDLSDWNDFNKNTWSYGTGTFEDHRSTFLGALIFMFNKMYEFNPDARAVFVIDSEFSIDEGRLDFERFSNEFGIPIIDLWAKMQKNPKTKTGIYSEGGTNTHPSTFAHERMGQMIANELLLIY